MLKFLSCFFLLSLVIAGCNDRKPVARKRVDTSAMFLDYRVGGNEETGEVTVRLQFFEGEEGGRTIRWKEPAKAELDGVILTGDSSKMNGFYYESRLSVDEFAGSHVIRFTDREGRLLNTAFDFSPITLKEPFPAQLGRKEHWIRLSGVEPGHLLRMLLIDTSFYSRGIDKIDTVRGDSISLTPRDFESLRNGPVYLEILNEQERPIQDTLRKITGRLTLSYSLKRSFILKD